MRHCHYTDAVDSRIRIRPVGGVELAAVSNPARPTTVLQLLYEFEVVIAGNTKEVANTNFLQAAKQKVSDRLFITHISFQSLVRGSIRARSGQM